MKIQCSNCMTPITIDFVEASVSFTSKASGRGSKRVEAQTVTNPLFGESPFYTWDSPCCEGYADSFEEEAS